MNINTLPDLCLRRIFYWLPLLDQITLDKVCPRWEALQSSVTSSRKAVTLIVSKISPDPQFESYLRGFIGRDSYIPFLDQIEPNSKPYSEKLYYSNLSQESIQDLTNVLPNITSLTIRIKLTGAGEMDLILELLEHWKTLLTVFEFDCRFEFEPDSPGNSNIEQTERCANQIFGLFDFINRELENLECLKFNLYDELFELWRIEGYSTKPRVLDLPCLGRLREFRFASHDHVTILFDSLKSYAAVNERLESIYIRNDYYYEDFWTIFQPLPALVRKFKALPSIRWQISSPELPRFLQTFTSLETLQMKFGEDLQKFTKLLAPLKNLIHFQATISDDKLKEFDSIPSYTLHQLPSVKILTIDVYIPKSFTELQSKHWGWIFPSVQLVHVQIMGCMNPKNERRLGRKRRNCVRKLLQPLKQLPGMKRLISLDIFMGITRLLTDESPRELKEWRIEEL